MTPSAAPGGRIVVGVDGSKGSLRALRWAIEEAAVRRATVQVISVCQDPYDPEQLALLWTDFGPQRTEQFAANARKRAEQEARERLMTNVAEAVIGASPVEIELVEIAGDPASRLCQLSADADLLVVGAPHHRSLARLVLGSVSSTCVRRSCCPVAIIPRQESRASPSRPRRPVGRYSGLA